MDYSLLELSEKSDARKFLTLTDVYDVFNRVIYLLTDLSDISLTVNKFMDIFFDRRNKKYVVY